MYLHFSQAFKQEESIALRNFKTFVRISDTSNLEMRTFIIQTLTFEAGVRGSGAVGVFQRLA